MKATDGIRVSRGELQALSGEWRAQMWDVQSARRSLMSVDLSGVPPSIAIELARFFDAWADALGEIGQDVQRVADEVAATGADLVGTDQAAGHRWP